MPGVYQPPIKRPTKIPTTRRVLTWGAVLMAAVVLALLVAASGSTLAFAAFADLCVVLLISLGWLWFEERRATAPERYRRRELAKAFPSARAVRVRVDALHRERLDINPALARKAGVR